MKDIVQPYLSVEPTAVRIRIVRRLHRWPDGVVTKDQKKAILGVKGPKVNGVGEEIEQEIPPGKAEDMARLSVGTVEKVRHIVNIGGFDLIWEVDIFRGDNEGLVLAEIEYGTDTELEAIMANRPAWLGHEVTNDKRFSNAQLAVRPWKYWKDEYMTELAKFEKTFPTTAEVLSPPVELSNG